MDIKQVYLSKAKLELTELELSLLEVAFKENDDTDIMKNKLEELSRDSNLNSDLYNKTLTFLNNLLEKYSTNFNLDMKLGNWGFRNERGRSVHPDGHTHVRDHLYFTTITTILGDGPWYELNDEKISGKVGETVIFSEEYFLENYPEKNLSPILHGSPNESAKRLILLCSFVPI